MQKSKLLVTLQVFSQRDLWPFTRVTVKVTGEKEIIILLKDYWMLALN